MLLFRVDLNRSGHSNVIFKLQLLLYTKNKIELPRKKNSLSQCKNYHDYHRTENHCRKLTCCVKCGTDHNFTDCEKSPAEPLKYASCKRSLTSSYKGCPSYKLNRYQIAANKKS